MRNSTKTTAKVEGCGEGRAISCQDAGSVVCNGRVVRRKITDVKYILGERGQTERPQAEECEAYGPDVRAGAEAQKTRLMYFVLHQPS